MLRQNTKGKERRWEAKRERKGRALRTEEKECHRSEEMAASRDMQLFVLIAFTRNIT